MPFNQNLGIGTDADAVTGEVRAKLREGVVRRRDPQLSDELDVDRLVERVRKRVQPWWGRYSRPFRVTFPLANTVRPIAHQLTAVPMGYLLLYTDAEVHASPNQPWTREEAFLQASSANAHALVIFFTLLEDWVDA